MKGKRASRLAALLLLGVAAVFIVIGVSRGEAAAVLQKAAVICMECIGLG